MGEVSLKSSDLKYSLILASTSPRRKELLAYLEIPFLIHSMQIEEKSHFTKASEVVMDLSYQKALATFNDLKKSNRFKIDFFPLVIGSDTVVVLQSDSTNEEIILGRPTSSDDAKRMLLQLSGKEHAVYTGVSILLLDKKSKEERVHTFYRKTNVTFMPLSNDLLERYVKTGDPLDKAGAYGIQGPALTFISALSGSYSNVVGFPLSDFVLELNTFLGFEKLDEEGCFRHEFNSEVGNWE